jgi:hypothetical protein
MSGADAMGGQRTRPIRGAPIGMAECELTGMGGDQELTPTVGWCDNRRRCPWRNCVMG